MQAYADLAPVIAAHEARWNSPRRKAALMGGE
jgi:hypothetical protein